MIKVIKRLLAVVLAGTVITAPAVYAASTFADEGTSDTGYYSVTVDDAVMKVDKETLNLEITRGGRTWYSGKRAELPEGESDGLNNLWASKLTDAVSVGYRDITRGVTTERPMTLLNSAVTFNGRPDGFDAKIRLKTLSLRFTLQVRLSGDKVQVTVPRDSIEESSDKYRLQYLLVYPFFDSSYSLADGQILVPDGSGAVIDLSVPTPAKQAYSARVYGADYGISAPPVSPTSPLTATMPVLALMYGDGGTMITADSGAEYCSVNASVSSITTQYNFAYFNWIYRETYVKYYESAGTDGKSYIAFQEQMNNFDLVQTMTLLDGGCAVTDVAKRYREKFNLQKPDGNSNAGLRLEFLMAENKKGMFGNETIAMTTSKYVQSVADEVKQYCNNLNISLLGYTSGGLNGSYPEHFSIESKTGGKSGYKKLSESLVADGINLAFVTDFVKAYENAAVSNGKLALNISNQFITLNDSRSGSSAKFRLMNADAAAAQLAKDVKKVKEYNAAVDYASIGSILYSGYKNSDFTRRNAADAFVNAVKESGAGANIVKPNDYMWGVCNGYLEAPLSSSSFMIETESVPFVQTVLSGRVDMYSEAVNLNYTGRELVLRLIDFNVYPSFTLTEKDALELYGTNSSGIFTSSYSIWKDTVKEMYEEVNGVLSRVRGATVEKRYSPAGGVYVTEYSNGVSVAVNYGDKEYSFGGQTVKGKSAAAFS